MGKAVMFRARRKDGSGDGAEAVARSAWTVGGASVAGVSHERNGLPCQDSMSYRVVGEALIASVADGAGSAELSDVGSALAAGTSVRTAELLLQEEHDHSPHPLDETCLGPILAAAVEEARCELEAESRRRGVEVRQLATTLLLAIHTKRILAVAQIGDGAVVVSDGRGAFLTWITPQRGGEYANQTNFLTSANAMSDLEVRVGRLDLGSTHLALFTDGLQNLALNGADNSPHTPFFAPLFAWMRSQPDGDAASRNLAAFMKSPKVTNRADDDLTLLLATLAG